MVHPNRIQFVLQILIHLDKSWYHLRRARSRCHTSRALHPNHWNLWTQHVRANDKANDVSWWMPSLFYQLLPPIISESPSPIFSHHNDSNFSSESFQPGTWERSDFFALPGRGTTPLDVVTGADLASPKAPKPRLGRSEVTLDAWETVKCLDSAQKGPLEQAKCWCFMVFYPMWLGYACLNRWEFYGILSVLRIWRNPCTTAGSLHKSTCRLVTPRGG